MMVARPLASPSHQLADLSFLLAGGSCLLTLLEYRRPLAFWQIALVVRHSAILTRHLRAAAPFALHHRLPLTLPEQIALQAPFSLLGALVHRQAKLLASAEQALATSKLVLCLLQTTSFHPCHKWFP